ncbi:unnamed protein product [Scytosiphon promiscuus]
MYLPEYSATDTASHSSRCYLNHPPEIRAFRIFRTKAGVFIPWIATFLLVVACGSLVAMLVVLALFFRKRNVFEIRARSAYLAMLSGTCLMTSVPLTILAQSIVLFGINFNIYAFYIVYYFVLVCGVCCYGSRTIRLAVLYNASVRKAVPWLASEWNHACACVLLGVASAGFPMYYKHDEGDGPFAAMFFAARAMDTLWAVSTACQALVLALYPLVWKTEDIFNIALELRVAITAALLVTVAGRLGENHLSLEAARWVNTGVMGFLVANIMFFISLGLPMRQLVLHPLESRDPEISRVFEKRKHVAAAVGGGSSASARSEDDGETASEVARSEMRLWTYEKVAAMPGVSAAFEDFTRKALCQESLLFLKDVTDFQGKSHDWGGAATGLGIDEGEGNDDRRLTFNEIVTRYIIDGAPDEVNISSGDKSNIVRVYEAGRSGFYSLSPRERRFIFARAYVEVRFVLESNLMNRFITTDRFKAALADVQGGEGCHA